MVKAMIPIGSVHGIPDSAPWLLARRTAGRALSPQANSAYSPACILGGLRALSLGAAGDTARELGGIVGHALPGGDWLGLERKSKWAYEGYAGRALTGVWLDMAARPEKGFETACKRSGVEVSKINLSSPKAGADISRWISEATDGFVSPAIDLNPLALVCVSSVLYLKDAWKSPFPKSRTRRGAFHAADEDVMADYMVGVFTLGVRDEEGVGTLVSLPLSNGASMVLLLPEEGRSLSDMLGDRRTFDLASAPGACGELVELHLPKFTCESTVSDMTGVLVAAGLSTASNPDLSRMTGVADAPVSYSHGTKLSVDENGLEAGSYFVVTACAGVPDFDEVPPKPRVIMFDRPFLYFVISRTAQPLLVGTVARPEADRLAWVPVDLEVERGPEEGWIIEDEEIPEVCRITLEEGCQTAPYGITCGVYGLMVHTTWAKGRQEAMEKYEGMKRSLRECAEKLGDDSFDEGEWCSTLVDTWS